MSNHNKIRPVNKDNLSGEYKILFSTPQTKNSNIPQNFRGLQIYRNKLKAEEALKDRKKLTVALLNKNRLLMKNNKRAEGNIGGNKYNLIQYDINVQKLKNAKIKRAQELFKKGYSKSKILRTIITEFKLNRNLKSRSWPKWLTELR